MTSRLSTAIVENIKYLARIEQLHFGSPHYSLLKNSLSDKGCIAIISNIRYLNKLKVLNLFSKNQIYKSDNSITDKSLGIILNNIEYMTNLIFLNLSSKFSMIK